MLITIDDVKAFLQSAGADFNDARIAPAIERATQRAKRLLGLRQRRSGRH